MAVTSLFMYVLILKLNCCKNGLEMIV